MNIIPKHIIAEYINYKANFPSAWIGYHLTKQKHFVYLFPIEMSKAELIIKIKN